MFYRRIWSNWFSGIQYNVRDLRVCAVRWHRLASELVATLSRLLLLRDLYPGDAVHHRQRIRFLVSIFRLTLIALYYPVSRVLRRSYTLRPSS